MIITKRIVNWTFTITRGEITYNLSIPAETQIEAANRLATDLLAIIEELKSCQKVGAN